MAFAGLDIGTSGCKMVVYSLDGSILYQVHRPYKEFGDNGYREIKPEEVLYNVKEVIKDVAHGSPEPIEAFSIATLGESIVCLDKYGKSLCNSMVTGDKRGIEETEKLIEQVDKEEIMNITGLPASEMYSLPKLIWMNENTGVFKEAEFILFYEDFIGFVLTGKRKVSYSSASRSMVLDIEKKEWSEKLLKIAGISSTQMSDPVPSGTILGKVKKEISIELNLSEDTIIVAGGHDQNCAALGAGVISQLQGEDGLGTCEVMLMMLPGALKTKYMIENDLVCVPYILPDTYLTYIEITTSGILMNWCRDTFFEDIKQKCEKEGMNFFEYMDELASNVETDLLILPQFGSSGNPNVNYDAKGLIWGLTVHTKPVEIYRAIKESMAFQMKMAYESLQPFQIDLDSIRVTGGGANSSLTLQIRADVFGINMDTLVSKESGTLGCMIIAATALGKYKSFEDGVNQVVKVNKTYIPNIEIQENYKNKYEQYKRLYKLMYNFK
jgi:xylulokinase